jgi:hypothetical protein
MADMRANKTRARGGPSKTSPAAIHRRERDLECVRLRAQGLRWDAIAARLGYSHASHAHRRFSIMMASIPAEDVAEARKLEVERLDAALCAIWEKVVAGNLWAIDRLLKISEQRCKLLGLNAPDRQVVITQEMVEAEIHRLEEMRVRAIVTGVPVPELEAGDDDEAGAS